MGKRLRILRRCFWVLALSALGFAHFALLRLTGPFTLEERAAWLRRYTRLLLPRLGVAWEILGEPPRTGLIVSNHLSYLDILVFSAATGCSFVSKAEVRSWPLFGWFARLAGTIFVWRHSAGASARACGQLRECLRTGQPVAVFPEATTSDGERILPFRSTMFQAAIDAGVPVTPAAVSYTLDDGSVRDEICFWGDMRPLPHAMNLFSKRAIRCRLEFGAPLPSLGDRKQLAALAYRWVTAAASAASAPENAKHSTPA